MKKIAFLILLLSTLPLLFPNTIANIIERKGQVIIIDKGRVDGVKAGLKGIIRAVYKDPSGEYYVNIGLFSVKQVLEQTAELAVDSLGSGFSLDDARYVVFEEALKPPEAGGEAPVTKPAKVSVDDLLEQGDLALAAGKYPQALDAFQKVLLQDPGNLIAKEKVTEIRKKMDEAEKTAKFKDYLRKSDSYFQKKDIKYAFIYLVEAFKVFPEGEDEIKRRLLVMDREYPQDFSRVMEEKMGEIGDMQKLVAEVQQRSERVEPKKPTVEEPVTTDEQFLREVRPKAKSMEKNEYGFWEAVFLDDVALVYIPEGDFTVGSPEGDGDADEHPAHKVFVKGYWMGKYEVTFEQFDRFSRETKSELALDEGWGRGRRPVINVSFEEVRRFCGWLSRKTGLNFRLPTEAEWEKAANDYYPWGADAPGKNKCNFNRELGKTAAVGSFPGGASKYGIMDLAGNVWEWVNDWYAPNYYQRSEPKNPQGPGEGTEKVVRGGCWDDGAYLVRSANRSSENPASRLNKLGFRIVLAPK